MIIGSDPTVKRDIEKLLKESETIARDWDTYSQFRQNRQAIMERFLSLSGENFN